MWRWLPAAVSQPRWGWKPQSLDIPVGGATRVLYARRSADGISAGGRTRPCPIYELVYKKISAAPPFYSASRFWIVYRSVFRPSIVAIPSQLLRSDPSGEKQASPLLKSSMNCTICPPPDRTSVCTDVRFLFATAASESRQRRSGGSILFL